MDRSAVLDNPADDGHCDVDDDIVVALVTDFDGCGIALLAYLHYESPLVLNNIDCCYCVTYLLTINKTKTH